MQKVTQAMIAKALNLSTSTVGLVVGECKTRSKKKLKPETVAMVKAKAAEMGYYGPDRHALVTRMGRSNLIGIIHFGSPFETGQKAAYFLPQAVNAAGYDYLVIDLHWCGGNVERIIRQILQSRVEGVLMTANYPGALSPENLDMFRKAKVPVVSLYGDSETSVPNVGDGAFGGFREIGKHLLSNGYRQLLFPYFNEHSLSTQGRIRGLRKALPASWVYRVCDDEEYFANISTFHQKDAPPSLTLLRGDSAHRRRHQSEAYYDLAKRLFSHDSLPDAFVAFNDRSAMGVYNAAYERGIRIPEDIAVTGADDDTFAAYPMFQLTTIRQDIEKSCTAALEMLLKKIREPEAVIPNTEFPSQLIIRKSCTKNPHSTNQTANRRKSPSSGAKKMAPN